MNTCVLEAMLDVKSASGTDFYVYPRLTRKAKTTTPRHWHNALFYSIRLCLHLREPLRHNLYVNPRLQYLNGGLRLVSVLGYHRYTPKNRKVQLYSQR